MARGNSAIARADRVAEVEAELSEPAFPSAVHLSPCAPARKQARWWVILNHVLLYIVFYFRATANFSKT